jgi:RNA polymerase sigma factor (sigma-70 family)
MSTFEEHSRQVYAWAYRLLGRHHDALDVVQDVFLRWSKQCRQSVPTQPRGWLRRVTINRAVDFCRRRMPVQGGMGQLEGLAARDSGAFAAGGSAGFANVGADKSGAGIGIEVGDEERFRGDVAAAFDGLTDAQRSVLVSKVFDGLTFAEIAAEQEVAVSTVKTHYLRAIRAVRDRLSPRWGEMAEGSRDPGIERSR